MSATDLGPPVGSLVRLRSCCGPGGVHEGHEDRCHVLPAGEVMSTTSHPHEHDHVRIGPELVRSFWEVVEQDCGAGVFLRRDYDKRTTLVDSEQITLVATPAQRLMSTRALAKDKGRHFWAEKEAVSSFTDPVTTLDVCEFCGAESFQWHGIPDGPDDSCRWRGKGRDRSVVENAEPCPGRPS